MNGARSYRIAELLGRGAFGSVYLADTVGTGIRRPVAIKVLRPEQAAIPGLLERLRDEARMLAMIRHRAIVRVDDLVELDGHWSVVMEYIEGCDVAALLQDGPLPPRVALAIAEEVANALHVAATQEGPDGRPIRLVHRDVKPGNIRVTAQGEVKLLDFGVARAEFSTREARGTNAVYGTPTYMAPERFAGQDTHAGDVYALGVTLFEMLAGEPPGAGPMEPERVPPGIKLAPAWRQIRETSAPLRDLVCAMLAPDPSDRPSARDCARALARIRGQIGGMTLEDWGERVVPPALRARRRLEDGRVGTVLIERPSQASLRIEGPPKKPRRSIGTWVAAAGGAAFVATGLLAGVLAIGAAAWWYTRGDGGEGTGADLPVAGGGREPGGAGAVDSVKPGSGLSPVDAVKSDAVKSDAVNSGAGAGATTVDGVTSDTVKPAAGAAAAGATAGTSPVVVDSVTSDTVKPAAGGAAGAGAAGVDTVRSDTVKPAAGVTATGGAGPATAGTGRSDTVKPAGRTAGPTAGPAPATVDTVKSDTVKPTAGAGPRSAAGSSSASGYGSSASSTASPPAPRPVKTGIVALSGKADSVMLMGNGSAFGVGEVPVGEYAAEITLTEGEPYTMRVVHVRPGLVTTISCDGRYCRESIE